MSLPSPGPHGYTLPVWVTAAARAALAALRGEGSQSAWALDLLQGEGRPPAAVPVRAASLIGEGWALAEARCDPGDGLDLTRGLLIWVMASWLQTIPPGASRLDGQPTGAPPWLELEAGEGVGVHAENGQPCLSTYALSLLEVNLRPLVPAGLRLRLRVVLPEGRALAERTSNAAFGVVEGLALIGTRAETQASADPHQLDRTLQSLQVRLDAPGFEGDLILVIGENGLDLAPRVGLPPDLLLKVGNWLGPVLVAASQGGVQRLLLFGYQGKLIKLAGGIFHTHHHLADGRAEVLTAFAALEGLSGPSLEALHGAPTVEAALAQLEAADPELAARLRARLALTVEQRAVAYLARHGAPGAAVGAALFDRRRHLCAVGPMGTAFLQAWVRPSWRGGT